ncbi:MAG: riboflavin synthase [Planctomycetota bacterium]
MFTGLIEEKGSVEKLVTIDDTVDITIQTELVAEGAKIGDSIAINGCCLTVVKTESDLLTFQAGTETLDRTNLGQLQVNSPVNLERALQVGDRLGGHYVSGHVDGLATVDERNNDGQWAEFWFRLSSDLTKQMASKGSVAVDGISLTLVNVERERFSVALIPHTLDVTTLGNRAVGDTVNIETDLLAKYVQQQMERSNA